MLVFVKFSKLSSVLSRVRMHASLHESLNMSLEISMKAQGLDEDKCYQQNLGTLLRYQQFHHVICDLAKEAFTSAAFNVNIILRPPIRYHQWGYRTRMALTEPCWGIDIHEYMCIYICEYIYTYVCTHTYIHTYVRTYVRTYIHTYRCKYTNTYI